MKFDAVPLLLIHYNNLELYPRPYPFFLFAYILQLFACFYENFCVEKSTSDMVEIFQRDYVENKCLEFVFNNCIHHIEIFQPCQTVLIFSICFLLLYGVMVPKIFVIGKSQKIPDDFWYRETVGF